MKRLVWAMHVIKYLLLLITGGMIYCMIELLFRGRTHWTMMIVGGICFVLCGLVNEVLSWDMVMWLQMLIGCLIITGMEFLSGCVLNIWLGLNVWDYSGIAGNVMGQICLPFIFLWYFLSGVAIVLDDYLRYWFFGERRPSYRWK